MLPYHIIPTIFLVSCMSMLSLNAIPVQYERRSKVIDRVKSALYKGQGTYYDVPGVGSCGKPDTNKEMVVAVNQEQMKNGVNPNLNPNCGKHVVITGDQGKTAVARVVDTCPKCNKGSLDMGEKVFKIVCGDLSKGKCDIRWRFKDN